MRLIKGGRLAVVDGFVDIVAYLLRAKIDPVDISISTSHNQGPSSKGQRPPM